MRVKTGYLVAPRKQHANSGRLRMSWGTGMRVSRHEESNVEIERGSRKQVKRTVKGGVRENKRKWGKNQRKRF